MQMQSFKCVILLVAMSVAVNLGWADPQMDVDGDLSVGGSLQLESETTPGFVKTDISGTVSSGHLIDLGLDTSGTLQAEHIVDAYLRNNGDTASNDYVFSGDVKVNTFDLDGIDMSNVGNGVVNLATNGSNLSFGPLGSLCRFDTDTDRFYMNRDLILGVGQLSSWSGDLTLRADWDASSSYNQFVLDDNGDIRANASAGKMTVGNMYAAGDFLPSTTDEVANRFEVGGRLYVKRPGYFEAAYIYNNWNAYPASRTHAALGLQAGASGLPPTEGQVFVNFYDGGGNYVGFIAGNSSAFYLFNVSDERAKKNIKASSFNSREIINGINTIEFQYADQADDTPMSVGFSAQNLQQAYPAAVTTIPAKQYGLDTRFGIEDEEVLAVAPAALIPVLVKESKRQQEEIDRLSEENKIMMEMLLTLTENSTRQISQQNQEIEQLREAMKAAGIAVDALNVTQAADEATQPSIAETVRELAMQ